MIEFTSDDKKDYILMQLLHYFITVENYSPMVVKGAKNEIWLEKMNADYRIIRINANYIHNNEQLNNDLMTIRNIVRQVKKKTLSFKINTLNILIDAGGGVEFKNDDKIDCVFINSSEGLKKSKKINSLYPELKNNLVNEDDKLEFIMNITNDINKKNEEENKKYHKLFGKKNISLTYILIAINIIVFLAGNILNMSGILDIFTMFANNRSFVKEHQIYRLITSAFLHQEVFHLLFNMYALYIIGSQVESFVGKYKFLLIYLGSAISASLLSCTVNTGFSLGASGAIFGLMGMLLYFGNQYRLYLDSALRSQIIPLIVANLLIGFIVPGIDNAAHIGGLIGGVFLSMAVNADGEKKLNDKINGIICFVIFTGFLSYLIFLR